MPVNEIIEVLRRAADELEDFKDDEQMRDILFNSLRNLLGFVISVEGSDV